MGSLVTGLLPSTHRAGYRRERIYRPLSRKTSEQKSRLLTYRPLSSRVVTLAERLRDAGYLTQGVYTNAFFGSAFGFARGYDRYDKFAGKRLEGATEGFDRALAWWEDLPPRAERPPAFLMMHVVDPHDPYRIRVPAVPGFEPPPDIPGEEGRRGLTRYVEARPQDPESREFPDQLAVYYQAEIRYLDDQVGRFLEAVEQPETAVLMVSDHGEAFAEHDRFIHGRTLHHEEVHVPLILKQPDGTGAGTTVSAPVTTVSTMATLLSHAGLSHDGLVPPLPSTDAMASESDIFSEAMLMGRDRTALRRGPWRYLMVHPVGIRGPARERPGGHAFPPSATRIIETLYNKEKDRGERMDVAAEHPAVLAEMRADPCPSPPARARGAVRMRARRPPLARHHARWASQPIRAIFLVRRRQGRGGEHPGGGIDAARRGTTRLGGHLHTDGHGDAARRGWDRDRAVRRHSPAIRTAPRPSWKVDAGSGASDSRATMRRRTSTMVMSRHCRPSATSTDAPPNAPESTARSPTPGVFGPSWGDRPGDAEAVRG